MSRIDGLQERAEYVSADDKEALYALRQHAHLERIICALESAHAVAECIKRAPKLSQSDVVSANISGRGDKYIGILRENLALQLPRLFLPIVF